MFRCGRNPITEPSLEGALNLPRDRNVLVISPAKEYLQARFTPRIQNGSSGANGYMGVAEAFVKAFPG
jgi:hypothetical protein